MPFIEPSADARAAAIEIRGLFNAYVEAGFAPHEALQLITAHIRAAAQHGRGGSS